MKVDLRKESLDSWKRSILIPSRDDAAARPPDSKWTLDEGGIVRCGIPATDALSFHNKMPKGAALRELSRQKFHLAYWETGYLKEVISEYLSDVNPRSSVVIDAGCGDGRFTEHLLHSGFQRIVAVDTHLPVLQSLQSYLVQEQAEDRVLLVNCSADRMPIEAGSADAVLAIGVYFYMGDSFEDGIREAHRCLSGNGILVNMEPDIEGALYRSMILESLDDVFENFFDRRFKEEHGETPFKFRCFEKDELAHILDKLGFRVTKWVGLPLFPWILRIRTVRGEIDLQKLETEDERLRAVLDYLNRRGTLHRHFIWRSVKVR